MRSASKETSVDIWRGKQARFHCLPPQRFSHESAALSGHNRPWIQLASMVLSTSSLLTGQSSPRTRRGSSLIEALVVVSVIGAITPLIFTMMATLMQAQAGQSDRLMTMISLRRLSTDLRRDLWSATHVKQIAESAILQLDSISQNSVETSPEIQSSIVYRIEQRASEVVIHRQVLNLLKNSEPPLDINSRPFHERYIFPQSTARWLIEKPPASSVSEVIAPKSETGLAVQPPDVPKGEPPGLTQVHLEIILPPPLVTTRTGSRLTGDSPSIWQVRISATPGQSLAIRTDVADHDLNPKHLNHQDDFIQQPADATSPENRERLKPSSETQGASR